MAYSKRVVLIATISVYSMVSKSLKASDVSAQWLHYLFYEYTLIYSQVQNLQSILNSVCVHMMYANVPTLYAVSRNKVYWYMRMIKHLIPLKIITTMYGHDTPMLNAKAD